MSRYYRCNACESRVFREDDISLAHSPFDESVILRACPFCHAVHGAQVLSMLCEKPGCPQDATHGGECYEHFVMGWREARARDEAEAAL